MRKINKVPAATLSPAVTVVTRVFEPEGSAAAFRLAALVGSLKDAGYATTVLTSRAPGGPKSSPGVRRWPVLRDRSGAVRGYVQYATFDIPLFFRILFGKHADVVIAEPPPTTGVVTRLACWLRRTPYVYYSADVLSSAVAGIGLNPFVVAAVRTLEQWTLRGASGVLAVSDSVREEVVALGARPENVVVVGTGIDTRQFAPQGEVAATGYPYFVYAGTMSEIHGAGIFIEAFAKISRKFPDVRLKMFGGGVEVSNLRARARQFSSRVEFHGIVEAAELSTWIRGAKASLASVRPDRGYDFAFATKALASLSCGTPVIYAGVGPLGPLISRNSLGWSTTWNIDEVAAAMTDALDRNSTAPDVRLAEWVESHFSLKAVADSAVAAISTHVPGGTGSLK